VLHPYLTNSLNKIIEQTEHIPIWLTEGKTTLLPKSTDTRNPKNYRPITCLPTTYKILTAIISKRISQHLERNDILPAEQKGCRKGSYGCKDQLLINKMILEDCSRRKRNLSTSWIDYKKAFDSVPHSWILKTLELYNINSKIRGFISESMKNWKTIMYLKHNEGTVESRHIAIRRGIFQGDSLSPLLFVLALAPLTELLNTTEYGYKVGETRYSHLLYMDDIKVYASNDMQQTGLLKTIKSFSDDIHMEFGIDKCAKATFKNGKLTRTSDIQLDSLTKIKELEHDGTYKYLGIHEGDGINHKEMKDKVRKEYYRRVRLVTRSELNSTNKFQAINALAVPVIAYSYNILNWQIKELEKIDTKTRKLLTQERMHHPISDVDRIYLSRAQGGRGLIQIVNSYKTASIGLAKYLEQSDDRLLRPVYEHESHKKLYSVIKASNKFTQELNLAESSFERGLISPTTQAMQVKVKAKTSMQEQCKEHWKQKALHGKYPERLEDPDVDREKSLAWLKSAGLKGETEGFIMAAQDQSLNTRVYRAKIIKDGSSPSCRLCHHFDESIDHIVSGCPALAKTDYIHRHDRVGTYIHWLLCRHYNIPTTEKWYEHKPNTVTENDNITILWDMPVHTDTDLT